MLQGIEILLCQRQWPPWERFMCLLSLAGPDEAQDGFAGQVLAGAAAPLLDHHEVLIQGEGNHLPAVALLP